MANKHQLNRDLYASCTHKNHIEIDMHRENGDQQSIELDEEAWNNLIAYIKHLNAQGKCSFIVS